MVKWSGRMWNLRGETSTSLLVKDEAKDNQSSDGEKLATWSQRYKGSSPAHMSSCRGGGASAAEATDHGDSTQQGFSGSGFHLIIKCKTTGKLEICL